MRDFLADLRDAFEDHRGKFLTAIACGLLAAFLVVTSYFHDILSAKGCSAHLSGGELVAIGLFGLFLIFIIFAMGSFIAYGSFHLPGFLGRWLEERRDPDLIEFNRRWREENPLGPRAAAFLGRNWKRIAAVPILIALAGLLAYVLGRIAWMVYC